MNDNRYSQDAFRNFYSRLGFDDDPFAYTNADMEERLPNYFVPPPYFQSVFGDPKHARSFVVFAPRGGGKTAQRIMIENRCAVDKVLAITYDRFEFVGVKKASEITQDHHLRNIIRFCLMGLLITLNADPSLKGHLSKHDKEVLVQLATGYLGNINEETQKRTLDTLKSLKDKVQEFWNEWLPLVGPGLTVLLSKLTGIELRQVGEFQSSRSQVGPHPKYELELLVAISRKIGYEAVYVLIDRVDEAELTGNDALASFQLISSLVRDLELLEIDNLAFKFFLWDQLEGSYGSTARTDRIRHVTLEWDDDMLMQMWASRLRAYSAGNISGLQQISESLSDFSIDELALVFANRSPRDMIRIGAEIVSEQQEVGPLAEKISPKAVFVGIEKFCATRSKEVVSDRTLSDLRRVQQVDFTISYLASVVFREDQTNIRNRIFRWKKEAAIVDVDLVENPNPQQRRPVKLFAIADIRVAKEVLAGMTIPVFMEMKYRKCPRCGSTVLRDWGDKDSLSRCTECQFDLLAEEDQDSWDQWKRIELASQTRRQRRREMIDDNQLSMFDLIEEDEVK